MRREIDGTWYDCMDIGCDSFERAAQNRKMIAHKENILGYLWIEAVVRAWPHNKPLPEWITVGKLPSASKNEANHFNQWGLYRIGDDGLIKVDKQRNKYYNEDINE